MTTLWCASALLPAGWSASVRVTIADGLVAALEPGVRPGPADTRIDIALPGLPNLHSHGFQRGMAGLAEVRTHPEDDFWSWRELMYQFTGRLTPDDLEALTAQAYVEMLESGFTRVGEFHYVHHDPSGQPYAQPGEMLERVAAAATTTGLGLTLLPVLFTRGDFDGRRPGERQRRFTCTLDQYARLVETARAIVQSIDAGVSGVAPHSLRTVDPSELPTVVGLADGGLVHIHVAEQRREVLDCEATLGGRPVEWLLDHAPVGPTWCLVHATHMTDTEARRLASAGAVAGLCPITEANLGDGIFAADPFLAARGAIGIGTDSNVQIDAAGELRALEYSQRLHHQRRAVLASQGQSTGRGLLEATLAGGSQALGAATHGLTEGGPADLVALDGQHIALAERDGDAWLDAWIFSGRPDLVQHVWSRGRQVVVDGAHVARDAVAARYRRTLGRLLA